MLTSASKTLAGVVVSSGKMMKTVKVRMVKQEWNRHLRKHFSRPYNVLVNDPNSSAAEGDIVTLALERHSRHVFHTIDQIVAPFGKPLAERPPLLTQAERDQLHAESRARKLARRAGQEVPSTLWTTVEEIIARRPKEPGMSKEEWRALSEEERQAFRYPKFRKGEWKSLSEEERQAIEYREFLCEEWRSLSEEERQAYKYPGFPKQEWKLLSEEEREAIKEQHTQHQLQPEQEAAETDQGLQNV